MEQEPWVRVKGLLDESWFCETPDTVRTSRLVVRLGDGGRDAEAAQAWAETVDGRNAVLVESTMSRADLVVSGETWSTVAAD